MLKVVAKAHIFHVELDGFQFRSCRFSQLTMFTDKMDKLKKKKRLKSSTFMNKKKLPHFDCKKKNSLLCSSLEDVTFLITFLFFFCRQLRIRLCNRKGENVNFPVFNFSPSKTKLHVFQTHLHNLSVVLLILKTDFSDSSYIQKSLLNPPFLWQIFIEILQGIHKTSCFQLQQPQNYFCNLT